MSLASAVLPALVLSFLYTYQPHDTGSRRDRPGRLATRFQGNAYRVKRRQQPGAPYYRQRINRHERFGAEDVKKGGEDKKQQGEDDEEEEEEEEEGEAEIPVQVEATQNIDDYDPTDDAYDALEVVEDEEEREETKKPLPMLRFSSPTTMPTNHPTPALNKGDFVMYKGTLGVISVVDWHGQSYGITFPEDPERGANTPWESRHISTITDVDVLEKLAKKYRRHDANREADKNNNIAALRARRRNFSPSLTPPPSRKGRRGPQTPPKFGDRDHSGEQRHDDTEEYNDVRNSKRGNEGNKLWRRRGGGGGGGGTALKCDSTRKGRDDGRICSDNNSRAKQQRGVVVVDDDDDNDNGRRQMRDYTGAGAFTFRRNRHRNKPHPSNRRRRRITGLEGGGGLGMGKKGTSSNGYGNHKRDATTTTSLIKKHRKQRRRQETSRPPAPASADAAATREKGGGQGGKKGGKGRMTTTTTTTTTTTAKVGSVLSKKVGGGADVPNGAASILFQRLNNNNPFKVSKQQKKKKRKGGGWTRDEGQGGEEEVKAEGTIRQKGKGTQRGNQLRKEEEEEEEEEEGDEEEEQRYMLSSEEEEEERGNTSTDNEENMEADAYRQRKGVEGGEGGCLLRCVSSSALSLTVGGAFVEPGSSFVVPHQSTTTGLELKPQQQQQQQVEEEKGGGAEGGRRQRTETTRRGVLNRSSWWRISRADLLVFPGEVREGGGRGGGGGYKNQGGKKEVGEREEENKKKENGGSEDMSWTSFLCDPLRIIKKDSREGKAIGTLLEEVKKSSGIDIRILNQRHPLSPGAALLRVWSIQPTSAIIILDRSIVSKSLTPPPPPVLTIKIYISIKL
eukprot:jgi/Bigna1/140144/aug1.54_g14852